MGPRKKQDHISFTLFSDLEPVFRLHRQRFESGASSLLSIFSPEVAVRCWPKFAHSVSPSSTIYVNRSNPLTNGTPIFLNHPPYSLRPNVFHQSHQTHHHHHHHGRNVLNPSLEQGTTTTTSNTTAALLGQSLPDRSFIASYTTANSNNNNNNNHSSLPLLINNNSQSDQLQSYVEDTEIDFTDSSAGAEESLETELVSGMWWKHLVAGAFAGAVSRTFTAPLDRLKVFIQVRGNEFNGLYLCFHHMIKEGGMSSLWRGNGVNVLKIAPETALKFMAYEQIKRFLKGNTDRELAIYERFFSGSIAGAISQSVIYPMEVLKTRLCLRATGQYDGIVDAAQKILRQEGARAFYRGYVPNLIGIIPYAGIDLATYETLKRYYLKSSFKNEEPGVMILLACGTISCTCGQMFSYPFALVRTRLQAKVDPQSTMLSMFKSIYRGEGFFGLYRGFLPNFLKVVPAIGVSYVVYENVRNFFGASMS